MEPVTGDRIDMDLYRAGGRAADGHKARGAVIVFPGGGYQVHAAHEAEPIARWLNAAGLTALVLRYRLAPNLHPAPLEDAARAVRLARHRAAEWDIDPAHIGVLGFSAGGHLVATLGTHFDAGRADSTDPVERHSSRPDAMVLCYPVISVERFAHPGSIENLLGASPGEDLLRELSLERHVTPQTPPAFLWHTAADAVVPVQHSLWFVEALLANHVPVELHIFPHGAHGLGLGDGSSFVGASSAVAQWPRLCETWLKGLGF
jgi:acetyl esterase/lipase